jgi:glycolate oxidase subunit GlcD
MRWCYEHDVPLIPRGGGTGLAGGAVAVDGGVVCSTERLDKVRELEPSLWRAHVEAGVSTRRMHRLARESGLFFPPDPGASEQSHVGGNVATNAGGPHAFKYGATGNWVTGLEVVIPPGELISLGGPYRKDVAGYDLKNLFIGSEGTLGLITAVRLRLLPAPEAAFPVIAFYRSAAEGYMAIRDVLSNGIQVAVMDYVDGDTLSIVRAAFPEVMPEQAAFALLMEVDGDRGAAEIARVDLIEILTGSEAEVLEPPAVDLWRWRDGISGAVATVRGGKVSEDIVVPIDCLEETLDRFREIAARRDLSACSWGHAGDGNIHAAFLINRDSHAEMASAAAATDELFILAASMGGSISGEHGVGWLKRGQLEHQWADPVLALHEQVKQIFDPKNLLNPGKKVARLACP